MTSKRIAPYGTWDSPITSDIVSGSSLDFSEVHTDPKTNSIYLIEGRPSENGRAALIEIKDGGEQELLPKEFSLKTKIHEYGGGAATVSSDGDIIFNDVVSGGVFCFSREKEVEEIIKGDPLIRYGDFDVSPDGTLILAVQEDHSKSGGIPDGAANNIVVIDTEKREVEVLIQGADFYSHPKFSPEGKTLSWMQWFHPDMPWTGTELYVADWKDGKLGKERKVAGQRRKESVTMPKWHFDGSLIYGTDATGWWQLYRYEVGTGESERLVVEGFEDAELGGREGILGYSTGISLNKIQLVITYTRNATNGLILYDLTTKTATELPLPLVNIGGKALSRLTDTSFVALGSTLTAPKSLYLITLNPNSPSTPTIKLLKSSSSISLDPSIFSLAQTITFPRTLGKDIGTSSYAIFLPPSNPNFTGPEGVAPPCIIFIHGGPTSHVSPGLVMKSQYFTSRGYAYCSVNHGGSTGYGRAYRNSLNYFWGITDCIDTLSCISYLSSKDLIDETRVGITGGSAGGYTTLQAMCSYPKAFAAGASLYGIGNLKELARDTHKFESCYLRDLLFEEETEEGVKEGVFRERSPCWNAGRIERPLLLLQGSLDRVVPVEQAREMEKVLKDGGKDVKLVVFEGEGHGFVMQKHIKQALEEEEALWKRTLVRL